MWLSPVGCALASLHVRISMQSHLGQRPAFIQHIAGLAVVEALTSLDGYQVNGLIMYYGRYIDWFHDV